MTRASGDGESESPSGVEAYASGNAAAETTQADYSFEGYSVEFIGKVALMPVAFATHPSR
jgi:hypothetical protein